jgi:GAF domain-containing protein
MLLLPEGYDNVVDPIPETLEAFDELDPYIDGGSLQEHLTRQASLARRIAPDLVGVSVASRTHEVTFTLVATDEVTATLDAVQYLTSGPCVEALDNAQGVVTDSDDLFAEHRWHALGKATAAAGVCSTLTFPIIEGGRVVGTVNLYGRTKDAFNDRHELLAAVFDAWAPAAVTNADLSFSTRKLAQDAPNRLRDEAVIDTATGIIAALREIDVGSARNRLEDAARRAGVHVSRLARAIVRL